MLPPSETLHSFARRILAEHPVEAGLPPVVEVLDEGRLVGADEPLVEHGACPTAHR
jgi:hypothetical protein